MRDGPDAGGTKPAVARPILMTKERGWPRRTRVAMGLLIGLPLLFLLILAVFPWGLLRDAVCRAATERFGRPVTIGSVRRVDGIGFHPTIAIEGLRIPQAGWAGPLLGTRVT